MLQEKDFLSALKRVSLGRGTTEVPILRTAMHHTMHVLTHCKLFVSAIRILVSNYHHILVLTKLRECLLKVS